MLMSEPHLLEPEIRSRCIENKDLGFEQLRINPSKLSSYIEKLRVSEPANVEIAYIRPDIKDSNTSSDMADYFQHSIPHQG